MRLIGETLVENGHRRIACLHVGPLATPDAAERIAVLDKTLRRHGIERPAGWSIDGRGKPDLGIHSLLKKAEPPTAFFCTTDRLAYTVIDTLERRGYRVPEDFSVVGYDGIRWPSETRHQTATVVVDLKAQAAAAVDLLLDPHPISREITVRTTFDPGTTLGPARHHAMEH